MGHQKNRGWSYRARSLEQVMLAPAQLSARNICSCISSIASYSCFARDNLGAFLGCSSHLTHQLVLFSTNERFEARLSLNCLQSFLACFIHIQAIASIIPIDKWKKCGELTAIGPQPLRVGPTV
ncbi:hypothetical protein HDV63DRAFT_376899 [Trichoderma sp. SZMC 28014]